VPEVLFCTGWPVTFPSFPPFLFGFRKERLLPAGSSSFFGRRDHALLETTADLLGVLVLPRSQCSRCIFQFTVPHLGSAASVETPSPPPLSEGLVPHDAFPSDLSKSSKRQIPACSALIFSSPGYLGPTQLDFSMFCHLLPRIVGCQFS